MDAVVMLRAGEMGSQNDVLLHTDLPRDLLITALELSLLGLSIYGEHTREFVVPRSVLEASASDESGDGEPGQDGGKHPLADLVRLLYRANKLNPLPNRMHEVLESWKRDRADDLEALGGYDRSSFYGKTRYALLREFVGEVSGGYDGVLKEVLTNFPNGGWGAPPDAGLFPPRASERPLRATGRRVALVLAAVLEAIRR